MHLIIMAFLPLSMAAGSISAAPRAAEQVRCPDNPTVHMARPGKDAIMRKLGDLPPGQTYAAVLRSDERGCVVPVLYNETRRRAAVPPAQRR